MKTVQQIEPFGEWQRHSGCPRRSIAPGEILANPPFQPSRQPLLNCAHSAVRPAIERVASTDEKYARGGDIGQYSNCRAEPSACFTVAPKDARRSLTAVDSLSLVYVVDDDISKREWLGTLISRAGWRCEFSSSAEEFLSKPRAREHSCLVLDFSLPDLTGVDLQKQLAGHLSDTPIVFLARWADVRMAVEAMKNGAIDFLTKPCDDDVLVAAIRRALERSREMSHEAQRMQAIRERHASLSRREHEVMTSVVTGRLNKQIGFDLGISEITVKAHRGQVMRKMGAKSLAALVTMAGQIGLATAPLS